METTITLIEVQNTNPPMFSKTEEPLDADDWLQIMENNLEAAGVEAAEKVLFATHYLAGPARAWWTSARAMNAGQMMTWEDFKLKFSNYHVPHGPIKKMRDEFRELKQGRMSVVEYRDKFLTLSRYAPDETDTNEKRKERFLNGLHDEMQTVLVNISFADLEALVDSTIQMEGKLHQANENRKRRMMHQNGPSNAQKYRNNSSGGFAPRHNKPTAQTYRPSYPNNNGGHPKPGGHNNRKQQQHQPQQQQPQYCPKEWKQCYSHCPKGQVNDDLLRMWNYGEPERGRGEEPRGPRPQAARPKARPRHPVLGAPQPLSPPFLRVLRKPKPQEILTKGYSRLCGAESTREKRALRAGIRRGNSLPEGEIDAIAIVIERDIISIIIIIISTIYTAITTAAPRHRCISMNEVRKKLFTISLSGKAAHWYKLLKNGDSIDWEDIVPLFYSKFYPPSEIHKDRNRIYNFWPHDGESIAQAWGRLKSLMLKCPIHELPGNVIIDNFYARLSFQDKTLLDTSCSGSFTRKNEEFKRDLLDRIQENTEGWENDKDRESVKDLVTENVEDGHIIFCEDASNIVSHPNKPKQVSVPMLSVRIGDHCYYGLCDIGASVSAIPYELYTEIMHEIGSCELEDIDVVIHLANRETISPIGIVRDVEVLCGKIKYPADFLQHLENSESEAFRKERDELEEIFLRQPILKHDLPVEDLGTTPPPKEDPVFDLKPLPDNLKYAHIDDKKIYPVIISSKLSEIEEERLENIAYDPVPVNDSFPNEQLAVIKVSSRESPWICFGSRSIMSSSGTQKDSFFEDVVNPYMNELKMHPKELQLVDGELQIKDVQGPKGEGSLEDRMEKLEQEVFNYKKMAEREVDIFHKIVSELIDGHKKETAKLWDDIFSLHDTTNKLQAQLYDVHNQNCEYENRFKRISLAASFRFPETKMSFVDGGPLPWKSDDDKESPSSPKE
ncbi:hypothetical protein QYE76_051315 [Lolium multiflorum]|uniref:Retrotransposon gag domain-containing protein n=1 Tax=Lolium multiflorum TaxID=4521 RepID=A0AAD8ST86_LOLMU|nr:hypothetical protein QYE76_051315 [Lolium multiflorum]